MKVKKEAVKREIGAFLVEEDGVGVIEIVLILVVLIGLVIIFKKQINSKSKEVYG